MHITVILPVRNGLVVAAFTVLSAVCADAQTMFTLDAAMSRARAETPGARALTASEAEAVARVERARSGFFPRFDISESIQRGDQPVYVFSSLLSQRRFTAANFDIAALNEPAPVTNVRTAITLDQRVYDGGAVRRGARVRPRPAARGRRSRQRRGRNGG